MTFSTSPMIFWITLGAVPALVFVATVIGRAWTILLPSHLQGPARYYLAPALGLATLTVMATLLGSYVPLGHQALLPLVFAGLAAWALARRHEFGLALRQSLWSGAFALACGAGILSHSLAPGARVVGPFQVALAQPDALMLGAVSGAHQRETDGQNWWSWVEGPARFAIEPGATPPVQAKTRVQFEYLTRGRQVLTLRVVRRDGSFQQIVLQETGEAIAAFDQLVDTAPGAMAELAFSTDGKASALGPADPRLGTWLIRNITLTAVPP